MPREVIVLAVDDKPWWMQPLFSFPFIGDLSVRQLLIVFSLIIPALLMNVALRMRFLESLAVLVSMLFVGLGVAKKPVRSVLPERQLLVFITGRYKPRVKPLGKTRGPIVEKPVSRAPETIEVFARDPAKIPTVKIVGVLRDPLGNPLVNQELEVFVNGRLYSRVKTGASGEYTIYYSPDGPGLYEIEIRVHGKPVLRKRVKEGVRG